MTFNEYQEACLRTIKCATPAEAVDMCVYGLTGELGEVVEMLKKAKFHGKAMDYDALCLELGDVLWYLSVLCDACGLNLEDVAQANIKKLRERYPDPPQHEAVADLHEDFLPGRR